MAATPTDGAIMAIGLLVVLDFFYTHHRTFFSPIAFFSALFFVEQFVRFFALDFTGNVALVLFVLLLPLTAVGNH